MGLGSPTLRANIMMWPASIGNRSAATTDLLTHLSWPEPYRRWRLRSGERVPRAAGQGSSFGRVILGSSGVGAVTGGSVTGGSVTPGSGDGGTWGTIEVVGVVLGAPGTSPAVDPLP